MDEVRERVERSRSGGRRGGIASPELRLRAVKLYLVEFRGHKPWRYSRDINLISVLTSQVRENAGPW